MCGSKKPPAAPPPPPPPPPPPKLVSPEDTTGADNAATTKASQTARAKLRIDLDPVAASSPTSTGLGIPG